MSTNYPVAIDNFNNPGATDAEDAVGLEHDVQHSNINDAVKALQTKVGIDNSGNASSVDYFMKHFFTQGAGDPSVSPGLPLAFYRNTTTGALFIWNGSAWGP